LSDSDLAAVAAYVWAIGAPKEGLVRSECLLLAQSRHTQCADECPLLGAKRTRRELVSTCANDPKRTLILENARGKPIPISRGTLNSLDAKIAP
jgi:hypothetical protein